MNTLIRDGFVTARRFQGTIVAENPPHLCNYGIVSFHGFSESKYTAAIQQAATALAEKGPAKFSFYCYQGGHIQTEGYKRLNADVESQVLAGLIFTNPPIFLDGTAALEQPGLPLVTNCAPGAYDNLHHIYYGWDSFLQRATEHLVSRGRKRIALIGAYLYRGQIEKDLEFLVRRKVGRPELIQSCALEPGSAYHAAMLLMKLSGEDRPDALIIRDDNLVEAATEGLAFSGVRIPRDLEVVAHCNFPVRPPSCVPVTRLGLDCRDMVLRDLECLATQREGRPFQMNTEMPVVFESELNGNLQKKASLRVPQFGRGEL
jgi:DNA-binding LacI/PurR family transcriptional regulator